MVQEDKEEDMEEDKEEDMVEVEEGQGRGTKLRASKHGVWG